ncbi:MAG: sugar kinase [Pseudonocardiales bacterium]|nr:sugar kinase [Pseudonocardiales bacterium]
MDGIGGAPREQMASVRAVLDLIRTGSARTRPALVEQSGLGRTAANQRLALLQAAGLIDGDQLGPSTGGRAPRELRFRPEAGSLLVADLGPQTMAVALTDLEGTVLALRRADVDLAIGPDRVLRRVERLMAGLLGGHPHGAPLWGIGVGVPGPVEFVAGAPVAPPIMPGWDGYPVRDRLAARFDVPAWIDNDANLLALGQVRATPDVLDLIFVVIGSGIGAGLTSGGRIHRGAQGAAGDIGHIAVTDDPAALCECGRIGCLEAVVGGRALVRRAGAASMAALLEAARAGDARAGALLEECGRLVGQVLASVVSVVNPGLIAIGGPLAGDDRVVDGIRDQVLRRALPLATRDLRIVRSADGGLALRGAAAAVLDQLLAPDALAVWLPRGAPTGLPQLGHLRR